MAKQMYDTPNLDDLEKGPWPSFVTGLKRLAKENDMMVDLLGQLETSYRTKFGYWKGGTVGVIGYGGGIIPRFTELKDEKGVPLFPEAAEFHTLRIMPPAGMHYSSDLLRQMCDAWLETEGVDRVQVEHTGRHVLVRALILVGIDRSDPDGGALRRLPHGTQAQVQPLVTAVPGSRPDVVDEP